MVQLLVDSKTEDIKARAHRLLRTDASHTDFAPKITFFLFKNPQSKQEQTKYNKGSQQQHQSRQKFGSIWRIVEIDRVVVARMFQSRQWRRAGIVAAAVVGHRATAQEGVLHQWQDAVRQTGRMRTSGQHWTECGRSMMSQWTATTSRLVQSVVVVRIPRG